MNDTSSVINNSAQSILAICSVLLNFLLILVCGKSKVITKNFANYTIIQTAIADLIYCIGILALILSETSLSYSITKGHSALNHCVIILGALFYGYQIRDITVVFITIDRWAALKYPVFFRKISLKTKMLLTFITCQIYAITTIILGFITKPKVRNQRACQAFYIYPPEYLRCFYGLGVVTTCVVIFFQVWITLLSHSMKSVSSKIERANKKNFHITTTKIPANTKNDYSKIKRTMTLVLVNYVVMWCLPQLAYFILLTVHANDDWNSLVSEIQNYFNIIHANLSMLIYLTTYSDLKKLFINFLLEK